MDNFLQFLTLKPNLYSTVIFAQQQQHCSDLHSSIFKNWRLRRRQAREKKKAQMNGCCRSDKHGRWLKQKFVTLFSYSPTHNNSCNTGGFSHWATLFCFETGLNVVHSCSVNSQLPSRIRPLRSSAGGYVR